jgi:hypothetical protein
MIRTQMGTHNRSISGHSAWGALYCTTVTVTSFFKLYVYGDATSNYQLIVTVRSVSRMYSSYVNVM